MSELVCYGGLIFHLRGGPPSTTLGLICCQASSLVDAEPRALLTINPCTWSTCRPATRRLSRKVSRQAMCVCLLSWVALSCCWPSLRSSSQTRTKSAGNQQGQKQGGQANPGMPVSQLGHPGPGWEVGVKHWDTWPNPLYKRMWSWSKGPTLTI